LRWLANPTLLVAATEINNLNEKIQSLLSTHRHEVALLQQAIVQNQATINETESNLTVIGTYVDKLEERLAAFAISRRDMDLREQKCKEIEERSEQADRERDAMKKKVEEFTFEHEDLKKLLEELVRERSALRSETEALTTERDKLLGGESILIQTITSLEQDVSHLDKVAKEWRSKVMKLELLLEEEADRARRAEEKYEALNIELNSMITPPEDKMDDQEKRESSPVLEDEFYDAYEMSGVSQSTQDAFDPSRPPLLPGSDGSDSTTAPANANAGEETGLQSKHENIPPQKWFKFFPQRGPGESAAPKGERPLPGSKPGPTPSMMNADKRRGPPTNRQDIRFRKLRKFFSQKTGMHGVFTPSSRQLLPPPTRPPPGKTFSGQDKGS
jgi:hypothetical protein